MGCDSWMRLEHRWYLSFCNSDDHPDAPLLGEVFPQPHSPMEMMMIHTYSTLVHPVFSSISEKSQPLSLTLVHRNGLPTALRGHYLVEALRHRGLSNSTAFFVSPTSRTTALSGTADLGPRNHIGPGASPLLHAPSHLGTLRHIMTTL